MKMQAEHPFEMIQVYGGYFGTDISPVQSDVYTKTGEEGRFVITEVTDMSEIRPTGLKNCRNALRWVQR